MFFFDLETGKIVQEVKTGKEEIKFNQLCNETKNGQKDVSRTILGIETQGMHQIDPRVADNSIVLSKQYKTNVLFNSIGTNLNGGFVVGSANGDIRMYKMMGQIAKTMLPGMGEPIKSIDVSQDQKWILATCQTYILVIPTENDDGISGFSKSIAKNKPKTVKLSIDPKDIVKNQIKFINFTPAKFNNGDNINETSIITSTGKLLVTWNFEKVKRGHPKGGYKLMQLP